MAKPMEIKIVDFSGVRNGADASSTVLEQLHEAFSTIGFVTIVNHGVEEKARAAFKVCRDFFDQPLEEKLKVARAERKASNLSGYACVEEEKMSPEIGDLKEFFHITDDSTQVWPENSIPFQTAMKELYSGMHEVAMLILQCMARALKLKDPLFFVKVHQNARDMEKGNTQMRVHNYPAIPSGSVIKPGQLRCGEHFDFGSITLLFADRLGGLQVKQNSGEYITVPHTPDALQVNIGAIMQRWTADQYIAPLHRVAVPDDDSRNMARISIPLFVHPDGDTLVECVDGSNKYPPILAKDEFAERHARVYF